MVKVIVTIDNNEESNQLSIQCIRENEKPNELEEIIAEGLEADFKGLTQAVKLVEMACNTNKGV